jgi:pantoate kinase
MLDNGSSWFLYMQTVTVFAEMQRTVVLVFVMNWSEDDQTVVQQLKNEFSCELQAGGCWCGK